jgi:hypothetical protein
MVGESSFRPEAEIRGSFRGSVCQTTSDIRGETGSYYYGLHDRHDHLRTFSPCSGIATNKMLTYLATYVFRGCPLCD